MSDQPSPDPTGLPADERHLEEHESQVRDLEIEVYDVRPNLQDVAWQLAEVFPCK